MHFLQGYTKSYARRCAQNFAFPESIFFRPQISRVGISRRTKHTCPHSPSLCETEFQYTSKPSLYESEFPCTYSALKFAQNLQFRYDFLCTWYGPFALTKTLTRRNSRCTKQLFVPLKNMDFMICTRMYIQQQDTRTYA